MFSVHEYVQSIETNLRSHSDLLIHNLQKVLSQQFASNVQLLDFTMFIEPTNFELSVMLFSMDTDGNEVFNEEADRAPFAGSAEIFPTLPYYSVKEELLDDFFAYYEEHEDRIAPREQKVFMEWFNSCWEQAGGKEITLPAYFGGHDEGESLDLKLGKMIDAEEKWE